MALSPLLKKPISSQHWNSSHVPPPRLIPIPDFPGLKIITCASNPGEHEDETRLQETSLPFIVYYQDEVPRGVSGIELD